MNNRRIAPLLPLSTAAAAVFAWACAAAPATAAPAAHHGYTLGVFAGALPGSSAPDSIATAGGNIFVGYGNGGAPDGSGGAVSTIAEYTGKGALIGSLLVAGHNDGLRYDAATGQLWALQNEDASPNVVLIDPATLKVVSGPLTFSGTPHGGGYDDVAFGPAGTFVSASNPAANPNTGPAIVSVSQSASQITVTGGVLAGDATATVINPGGGTTTLNLQDPDSLIFANDGRLVLDSQADQQLVFLTNPGTIVQSASVLNLASTVDDTVFARGGVQRLLFTDRGSNLVYALTGRFGADQAISAADTLNQIVAVNGSTGGFNPLVTGLNGPHGEAFTAGAVPEPAGWSLLIAGFGLTGWAARRRRPVLPAVA